MGLSSWAFAAANDIQKGTLTSLVCGQGGTQCQPVPVYSPFQGYSGPSRSAAQDLFSTTEAHFVDGGLRQNNPLWPLITPTRQADVAIVIDNAGAIETPPVSTDPPGQCTSDSTYCPSGNYYGASKCCDECNSLGELS